MLNFLFKRSIAHKTRLVAPMAHFSSNVFRFPLTASFRDKLKHGAILYNEAEVFNLSITNPNGWPMLPFDWLIPSGLILASCHRILFFCRFSAVEK